jgi:hypothetical protein
MASTLKSVAGRKIMRMLRPQGLAERVGEGATHIHREDRGR